MFKIIMLSGGSESTALLFKEIKELKKEDRLIVHHVHLVNTEDRYEAEEYAVRNIVNIARGYTDFIFTNSRFDYPDILSNGYCGMDIHTIGFISGHITKQTSVAFNTNDIQVLFGASLDDEGDAFFDSSRYKMMISAFNSHFIYELENKIEAPKLYFPYIDIKLKDQFKYIPYEVEEYIISCRHPVKINNKFLRCGNCQTCKKIQNAGLLDAKQKR